MTFLRNAWYCVGYPEELANSATKALTVLGEPLLLYRLSDGTVTALHDRCPHRFAPLSKGKIVDDQVQCPYHGLRFDSTGRCTHNPHGSGVISPAACVRSYPVLERHALVWVWMGDAAKADPAVLPDFSDIEERPGWARAQGYLRTPANYELIIDNLLDLTHVRYLHPMLGGIEGERREPERIETRLEQRGDSVVAIFQTYQEGSSPLVYLLWEKGPPPELVDARANMRWDAPALLLLDNGFTPAGRPREEGCSLPSAHLLTPETETSTHYFWVVARDSHVENPETSEQLAFVASEIFSNEDSPMLQACQQNMGGTTDLMSLNPVMLQTDASALRARRLLKVRLQAEAAG